MSDPIVAGIELGGTKAIAVVGSGRQMIEQSVVPTTTADQTLGALADILTGWAERYRPQALGIASFGPIDLDNNSTTFGHMLATPKPGWAGADIVCTLAGCIDGPSSVHTDVTAAALAEGQWGAGQGLADYIYVTIGTGIGMGIISGGQPVTGRMHPEAGHLRVRRMTGDEFEGCCPFHGDCLEGLASGQALSARFGGMAQDAAPDDPRWAPVVHALAEGFAMLSLAMSPRRIIVGGGVGLGQAHLLPGIRIAMLRALANYLPGFSAPAMEEYVCSAALGAEAGPLGALALAQRGLAA